MKTFEVEVGALIRSKFREYLELLKFEGYNIGWYESKGWVISLFTIKGDDLAVYQVKQLIGQYSK